MPIEEKLREIMLSEELSDSEKLDRLHALIPTDAFKIDNLSEAMALIPLLLYYSSFRLAAERLFEVNKYAVPNTHVLYLITQKFGLDPGKVFEDLFRASQGVREGLCLAERLGPTGIRGDSEMAGREPARKRANDVG